MGCAPDLTPWLGVWTQARQEEEAYNRALEAQGLPWAVRKLLQHWVAMREFRREADGALLFRSKMLTGFWNELHPEEPTNFSVLGYSIDTLVTWEDDGATLVATMKTTAADRCARPAIERRGRPRAARRARSALAHRSRLRATGTCFQAGRPRRASRTSSRVTSCA